MDDCDSTEERRAAEEAFALRKRQAELLELATKPPLTNCEDCDDSLPPFRQTLHCTRCVDCQRAFEQRTRQYRRMP